MTDYRIHHDDLPGDFTADLIEVDDALARAAKRQQPPAGLAQRTYQASVGHLPVCRATSPVVVNQGQRSRFVLPMLSRLAVAASVTLAVVVTVAVLRGPVAQQRIAHNGDAASAGSASLSMTAHQQGPSVHRAAMLSAEREFVLLDSMQLSYFSEVRGSSMSDLAGDLADVVRELEM